MNLRDFRRAGHGPTLLCAFLYFDISFMIWVMVGALANSIVDTFSLSPLEKGFLVAVPILGGAVLRLVLGLLTDQIGARRTALIGMVLTVLPLVLGWLWADSFGKVLLVGLLLGVAGASFAAALPLASRWYPPQYQGLALGIAGAGNSGTALATFFGPRLAVSLGWHTIFGLALVPLGLVLVLFACLAKDSPNQPPPKRFADYVAVLRLRDTWRLCLFYSVTFGGFVGLASYLNIFFHKHYDLSPVQAGTLVTLCVFAGSFLRPLGGYLADRIGGISLLTMLYVAVGVLLLDQATSPPMVWGVIVFVITMGLFGLGNGAVFQLVPQRFPKEIGVVTGIVGAAGGVGGFFLPTLLGGMEQLTGGVGSGFFLLALAPIGCVVVLVGMSKVWEGVFVTRGGLAPVRQEAATGPVRRPELAGSN
ncbi:MAG: NarK/NasA family nitrate transporter [Planctomycetes bacterium]|nr:NarK/NasA family nitrate transporter [Planctomycetota bacterium]